MCVWSQSTLLYLEASFRIMYLETKLLEDQPPKPFQRQQNGKGKRKQKQVQQQQSSTNDETIQQQRDKIHDLLT